MTNHAEPESGVGHSRTAATERSGRLWVASRKAGTPARPVNLQPVGTVTSATELILPVLPAVCHAMDPIGELSASCAPQKMIAGDNASISRREIAPNRIGILAE